MDEVRIAYIGNGEIATDFYLQTKEQKAKRSLLGIQRKYDIMPLEMIKQINEQSEKLFITGLNKKVSDNMYLFNYLIENKVDISKVVTLNGSLSHHWGQKANNEVIKEKLYKNLFDGDIEDDIHYRTASELMIIALESMHNLFWRDGQVNEWEDILLEDKEALNKMKIYLEDKYKIPDANKIFKKDIDGKRIYEIDKEDEKKFKVLRSRASSGFQTYIKASKFMNEHNTSTSGIFFYTFERNNSKYWKLNKDYNIVSIRGLGYQYRLLQGIGLNDILSSCGMQSLTEYSKGGNTRFMEFVCKENHRLTKMGVNSALEVNQMLSVVIKSIYELSSDIHLYMCGALDIAFAVKNTVNITDVLRRIDEVLNTYQIYNCFDCINVIEAINKPWSIQLGDIDNAMRLNMDNLKQIDKMEYSNNVYRDTGIKELFNKLKERAQNE